VAEFDVYGIFVSPLLVLGIAALIASAFIRGVLARTGFYRLVWHPALFDLALFVILLGAAVALFTSRV
jgi:protein-S-isoprenylcysteine O-methyltransferase Ste14